MPKKRTVKKPGCDDTPPLEWSGSKPSDKAIKILGRGAPPQILGRGDTPHV